MALSIDGVYHHCWLIVGNLGMRYCKYTQNALYISVCEWHILECVIYVYIGVQRKFVYVWVSVCPCGLPLPLFQVELSLIGCLFSLHHVNHGGFQTTPQVTLQVPHCWSVSQETQSWQAQPGTASLAGVTSDIPPEKKRPTCCVTNGVYSGKRLNTASVRSAGRV